MRKFCGKCGTAYHSENRFCTNCGASGTVENVPAPTPPPVPGRTPSPPPAPVQQPFGAAASSSISPAVAQGRWHSPVIALLAALLIPGAGQAYNGRPIKGFFVLFFSVLVIPWLLSLWGAYRNAGIIQSQGGRYGPGGFVWIALQGWLAANVALLVLIGLTIAGVVR